jgi:hypothetical protein
MQMDPKRAGVHAEIPGGEPLTLTQLILDFTGTLPYDGAVLSKVAERLEELGQKLLASTNCSRW